jgi:hypothetical protein
VLRSREAADLRRAPHQNQLPNPYVWIGFNDAAVEGSFEWVSGEPSSFTSWDGGQPDNFQLLEDYTHLGHLGNIYVWNDCTDVLGPSSWTCRERTVFGVVEIGSPSAVPEPGSIGLLAIGVSGLLLARRRRSCTR